VAKSERVLGEYRRFLFLAMAAGHPVSPSRAVALAWHQHLLDTRSYWQEFCPRVLGQPLHHTPSRGSEEERQRLGERYRRTLTSYRACFGEAPLRISGLRLSRLRLCRLRLCRWPPRPGPHGESPINGEYCWRRLCLPWYWPAARRAIRTFLSALADLTFCCSIWWWQVGPWSRYWQCTSSGANRPGRVM
jgi:hypothetical protein